MNGATPRGPRVLVTRSTNPRITPIATGESREKRGHEPGREVAGHELAADADGDREQDAERHERRAAAPVRRVDQVPQVGRRPSEIDSARKKIQATHTMLKVTIRRGDSPAQGVGQVGEPAAASAGCAASARTTDTPPWIAPQTTNVHAAPCHRPPRTHREHEVAVRLAVAAAVSAERDVEVVAQPPRQRHVPATPEVLDRRRGVRAVEVQREAEAEQQREPMAMSV